LVTCANPPPQPQPQPQPILLRAHCTSCARSHGSPLPATSSSLGQAAGDVLGTGDDGSVAHSLATQLADALTDAPAAAAARAARTAHTLLASTAAAAAAAPVAAVLSVAAFERLRRLVRESRVEFQPTIRILTHQPNPRTRDWARVRVRVRVRARVRAKAKVRVRVRVGRA